MRILQLCNKMVFPARDGYALAVLNLSKAFAARGDEAELLCMNTSRHYVMSSRSLHPFNIRSRFML